ncbi:MAG: hypothetical protein KDD33_06020 [Bdellovibrionales bacterium]|nr:hypothetical protein [Bdellovibrionales bacterium]
MRSVKLPKNILMSSALVFLCSCAAFAPKLDKERAKQVRKVAILSFEIIQAQPKDALGLSQIGSMERRSDSKPFKDMAEAIYKDLSKAIQTSTGWEAIGLSQLRNSDRYAKLYQQKMTGLRMTSIVPENSEIVFVNGVLDNANFRRLDFKDKVALAKSVGADAFAEYVGFQRIDQGFSIGNLVGEAEFSFITRSNLMVYGFDSEEPVWRIQNIDGPSSEKSGTLPKEVKILGRLSTLGRESAKNSIEKLVKNYSL